ncbi:hypothetical protein TeGR_g3756, partial [Tetraparma gracilis]
MPSKKKGKGRKPPAASKKAPSPPNSPPLSPPPAPTPTNTPSTLSDMDSRKRKLERRMSADTISSFILNRPSADEASRTTQVSQVISPSITQNRKKVERRLSEHKISDHLKTRPSAKELHSAGIFHYHPDQSAIVQNASRKLERKLTKNTISGFVERSALRRQSSVDQEVDATAAKMATTDSVTLSRRMCSDAVAGMLQRKQSIGSETEAKRAKVAPSLQSTHRVLERKMSSDNVKSLLENRPSVAQLQQ